MKAYLLLSALFLALNSFAKVDDDTNIEDAKHRVLLSLNQSVSVYNYEANRIVQISKNSLELQSIACEVLRDGYVLCGLQVKEDKKCEIGSELVGIKVFYGLVGSYAFGKAVDCGKGQR